MLTMPVSGMSRLMAKPPPSSTLPKFRKPSACAGVALDAATRPATPARDNETVPCICGCAAGTKAKCATQTASAEQPMAKTTIRGKEAAPRKDEYLAMLIGDDGATTVFAWIAGAS